MSTERPRTALVHDWLTGMRGGERVLQVLCEQYPDADLFTLLHVRGSVSPAIERRRVHTSALQYLPGVRRYYRQCLPLFPTLVEQFDCRDEPLHRDVEDLSDVQEDGRSELLPIHGRRTPS